MTVIHIDCASGVAGDMLLGALLDAGAPETEVRAALEALDLGGWSLEVTEVRRAGLRALRAEVTVTDEPSRSYADIKDIIGNAPLPDEVRARALSTFRRLAEAEAAVHGTSVDEVHFHELGATDALVDIVGVCAALSSIGPGRITCSAVATGAGSISTEHGTMPVPAPAVAVLLEGVPVLAGGDVELATPTGAALLREWCDSFGHFPPMTVGRSGYGAGARDLAHPNVVRVLTGEALDSASSLLVLTETNLDDMSPELLPHVIARLIEAGANDAWVTPIAMKKGRSAHLLSVLSRDDVAPAVQEILFAETTTLGVRVRYVERIELERDEIEVDIGGHTVRVKAGMRNGVVLNLAPEFEDASAAAAALGRPLKDVYAEALELARRALPTT